MSANKRPLGTVVLVGIVIGAVVLTEIFRGTGVAAYVAPIAAVLCAIAAWFLMGSRGKGEISPGIDSTAEEQHRRKALLKGLLLLLAAIGWGLAVGAAVRVGVVPSDLNVILWSLAPTFVLMAIAMAYLFLGFSRSFDG